MAFFSRQISSNKWGIYSDLGLLATVSCKNVCETVMANLENGRRDVPTNSELKSLYQVPKSSDKLSEGKAIDQPAIQSGRYRSAVSKRKKKKVNIQKTGNTASEQMLNKQSASKNNDRKVVRNVSQEVA